MKFCILAPTKTNKTKCRRRGCGQVVYLPPGCAHDGIEVVCSGTGGLGSIIKSVLKAVGIRAKRGCRCFQRADKLDKMVPWI